MMPGVSAMVSSSSVVALGATALLHGLRHGVDWDHIAAITDLTSGHRPRQALRLATAYAAGHAAVVFALGTAAVLGSELIPETLDAAMGRLVGLTLVVLGVAIVVGLVRDRRDFRLRSRWMYLADGAARVRRWASGRVIEIRHDHPHDHGRTHRHDHGEIIQPSASDGDDRPIEHAAVVTETSHRHWHTHTATVPVDPFGPGPVGSFGIGMLHGIGAETPTQVLVFVTAANAAGGSAGVGLLACFIAGILVSNTVVAAIAAAGYLSAGRHFGVYVSVAAVNAAASIVVGTVLVLGGSLPALLGG